MAHLEPLGEDALEKMASGMGMLSTTIDDVAQTCINKADPIMERIYAGAIHGAGQGTSSAPVATTPAKKNFIGNYSVSRPVGYFFAKTRWEGYDPRVRYGMLGAFYNYGVGSHDITFKGPNRYGNERYVHSDGRPIHPGMPQGQRGWMDAAAHAAEGPVTDAVTKAFDEEVNKLIKP